MGVKVTFFFSFLCFVWTVCCISFQVDVEKKLQNARMPNVAAPFLFRSVILLSLSTKHTLSFLLKWVE